MWVKLTEVILQLRPRALWRVLFHRDPDIRAALRWCYGVGQRAWFFEVREFHFSKFFAHISVVTMKSVVDFICLNFQTYV